MTCVVCLVFVSMALCFPCPDNPHLRKGEVQPKGYYAKYLNAVEEPTSHFEKALEQLNNGRTLNACLELGLHVDEHPKDNTARIYYAELLVRVGRLALAERQFQNASQLAHELDNIDDRIHCHRRLMEIAEATADAYQVHLNRGIGIFLLAEKTKKIADFDQLNMAESMLCRAAGELAMARLIKGDDARPCWYLALIWQSLGQQTIASRHLHEALELVQFSTLNTAESRELVISSTGSTFGIPRR